MALVEANTYSPMLQALVAMEREYLFECECDSQLAERP